MIRSSILASAALSLVVLTTGCDKAADDQAKATQAQAEADAKIAALSAEASAKVKAVQADADKKIAEAQASFMQLREDYRHATTTPSSISTRRSPISTPRPRRRPARRRPISRTP